MGRFTNNNGSNFDDNTESSGGSNELSDFNLDGIRSPEEFDQTPSSGGDGNSDSRSDEPKRRGRPSKSGNENGTENRAAKPRKQRASAAQINASIDALSQTLKIVHLGIAAAVKEPSLVLNDQECESLAKATSNFLIQFEVTPDPKIQALIGLVTVAGSIYGPRAIGIYTKRKRLKNETS